MLSISNRVLGSPKSLNVIDGAASWGIIPEGNWVLGDPGSPRSAEALLETAGRDIPSAIPEEYLASMEGIARGQIPWPLIIPSGIIGEHARMIAASVDDAIDRIGDYAEVLANSRRILCRLQACKIDMAALRSCQGDAQLGSIDSFEPGQDFTCDPPIYSHATATGRLVVKEGPKILTIQKEHRRVLSSRFPGGKMMQIDFISLEPRVLRLLRAGDAPVDLYTDILSRVGGDVSRRQVKVAVLRSLYGSSKAGIREEVGAIGPKLIREVEDYFGLKALQEKLHQQLRTKGHIKSHWGRPLREATDDHLLVSHFTQSTAVDVSLLGFGQLTDRIIAEDLDVIPCFVLHDALLLDTAPQHMERLGQIAAAGIDIDGLGHFEVSFTPAYLEPEES
jgi:hypothetical protein